MLEDINLTVSTGEKIALIGRNGAGKTTLFKLICSELSPDSGHVQKPSNFKIGYLSQHFDFDESRSIKDVCMDVFKEYFETENRINNLNEELTQLTDEARITALLEELESLNMKQQASVESHPLSDMARILKGLGFKETQFDDEISKLSGGWKMRVQIAKLLLMKPDLLLLDEPDNHLDIEALIWFEKYVLSYPGAVLFISHDVEFMSNTANRILELSNRRIADYKCNYKRYLEERSLRREKDEQAFVNQQKQIKQKERTINRFMAKATKTKMAQSMQKQLDKIERIEIESDDFTNINISFPHTSQSGKKVLELKGISKSFGDNKVIDNLNMVVERGKKIAFVGQNGQGKSTLVKIIAGAIKPDEGEVELGHNVMSSYFAQNQSEVLDEQLDLLETLESRADSEFVPSARKTLGAFAFSGDEIYKKVSVLSGGEKSRLAMACLVSCKSNFLLLDEPTNHLDIHSKAILKSAIENYPGTLIIVSHDREILRGVIDETFEFRDGKIKQHLGDLDYVMSKREAESVRELESTHKDVKHEKSNKTVEKPPVLSYEEQKKFNRKISKVEKDIDKIEQKIEELQTKLIDVNFYNSAEGTETVKKLHSLESQLAAKNLEWDALVSQLDS